MKNTTCKLAGAVIAFAAQFASAQGMGGMGAQNFAAVDTDGDGELTLEELLASPNFNENQARQRLETWDTDDSGTVSEEEFNNRPRGGGMGMG